MAISSKAASKPFTQPRAAVSERAAATDRAVHNNAVNAPENRLLRRLPPYSCHTWLYCSSVTPPAPSLKERVRRQTMGHRTNRQRLPNSPTGSSRSASPPAGSRETGFILIR